MVEGWRGAVGRLEALVEDLKERRVRAMAGAVEVTAEELRVLLLALELVVDQVGRPNEAQARLARLLAPRPPVASWRPPS